MRLIFMGTPDFAVPTLQTLLDSRHEVCAVFTQPDKPKGRGKAMQMSPVKELALSHGIPVFQPRRMRDAESIEQVRELAADCIVVAAYGQILPKEVLDAPKYGCINVHGSLLPKYRGAAPIQWSILNGDSQTGITIMKMDVGLDTGDMMLKRAVPIAEDETGDSLFEKLSRMGGDMVLEVLSRMEEGTATYEKQEDSQSCYAKMLRKEMGHLDFTRSAKELERWVRGLNSWPGAYTDLNGTTLKIWKAAALEGGDPDHAGTVLQADKDGIRVQTGDGILNLLEVQLAGKKRMPADAFLRGYAVEAGSRLG